MEHIINNPITSEECFERALKSVLLHEGGYSDNPDDPGGATNFGITQKELSRIYKIIGIPPNVGELDENDAAIYYRSQWWDMYHFYALNSVPVACKLFDMAVNIGITASVKMLQLECNRIGYSISVDGAMGANTIGTVNRITNSGKEEDLLDSLVERNRTYYENLVKYNTKLKVFLDGWLNRAAYRGT